MLQSSAMYVILKIFLLLEITTTDNLERTGSVITDFFVGLQLKIITVLRAMAIGKKWLF